MRGALKVAITGAHSTGKSTFLDTLEARLSARGLRVGRVAGLARRALMAGFPILQNHTLDSTLWLMAEGLREEAALSLDRDVILVDRPPLDAVAYLLAALKVTNRTVDKARLSRLQDIARASTADYAVVIFTELDPSQALGPDRDPDLIFRATADAKVSELVARLAPHAVRLRYGDEDTVLSVVERACAPL